MDNQLDSLLCAVGNAARMIIVPHNDPDPDAVASAIALRHLLAHTLGTESRICYRGIVGRAENIALVRYLDNPLRRLGRSDLRQQVPVALVDTQPGAGNNPLPAAHHVAIVLDHHTWRETTAAATFADVRPEIGATSTILTEYLQAAEIEITPTLATALFYGIKTDTLGLGRGASPDDVAAYFYLQPRIDVDALAEIEHAQVPPEYFQRLDATLHAARVHQDLVTSYLGSMHRPDMAAEMADLLLRLQGVRWAICMGVYKDDLILAVRTRHRRGGVRLVQVMVGDDGTAGGHGTMAGGQVPLQGREPEEMAHQLGQRALRHLRLLPPETEAKPLIDSRST
jgi:nanoRNase/pAp phosphatase (c-di-AMP/oligoRNAs hydrolase)